MDSEFQFKRNFTMSAFAIQFLVDMAKEGYSDDTTVIRLTNHKDGIKHSSHTGTGYDVDIVTSESEAATFIKGYAGGTLATKVGGTGGE